MSVGAGSKNTVVYASVIFYIRFRWYCPSVHALKFVKLKGSSEVNKTLTYMNTQKNKRSIEDMVDNFYVVYRKAVSLFFKWNDRKPNSQPENALQRKSAYLQRESISLYGFWDKIKEFTKKVRPLKKQRFSWPPRQWDKKKIIGRWKKKLDKCSLFLVDFCRPALGFSN